MLKLYKAYMYGTDGIKLEDSINFKNGELEDIEQVKTKNLDIKRADYELQTLKKLKDI